MRSKLTPRQPGKPPACLTNRATSQSICFQSQLCFRLYHIKPLVFGVQTFHRLCLREPALPLCQALQSADCTLRSFRMLLGWYWCVVDEIKFSSSLFCASALLGGSSSLFLSYWWNGPIPWPYFSHFYTLSLSLPLSQTPRSHACVSNTWLALETGHFERWLDRKRLLQVSQLLLPLTCAASSAFAERF